MNQSIIWMIIVAVMLVLLLIIAIMTIKKKQGPGYYALFIMGAFWFPIGLIMMMTDIGSIGNIFFVLGWVYFVIGLANKDKWKKNRSYLVKDKFWKWLIIILILLVLIGLVVGYLVAS